MKYWLGIDVGTGGSRALLVDAGGQVRHSFTAAHEDIWMFKPLWAEQHPDDWWRASKQAVRGVLEDSGIPGSSIRDIGPRDRACLHRQSCVDRLHAAEAPLGSRTGTGAFRTHSQNPAP